jgi:hypothetical protein
MRAMGADTRFWDLVVSKDPDGLDQLGHVSLYGPQQELDAGWPQYNSHLSMMFKEKYLPRTNPYLLP